MRHKKEAMDKPTVWTDNGRVVIGEGQGLDIRVSDYVNPDNNIEMRCTVTSDVVVKPGQKIELLIEAVKKPERWETT